MCKNWPQGRLKCSLNLFTHLSPFKKTKDDKHGNFNTRQIKVKINKTKYSSSLLTITNFSFHIAIIFKTTPIGNWTEIFQAFGPVNDNFTGTLYTGRIHMAWYCPTVIEQGLNHISLITQSDNNPPIKINQMKGKITKMEK